VYEPKEKKGPVVKEEVEDEVERKCNIDLSLFE
jgi:hypothetical protein